MFFGLAVRGGREGNETPMALAIRGFISRRVNARHKSFRLVGSMANTERFHQGEGWLPPRAIGARLLPG